MCEMDYGEDGDRKNIQDFLAPNVSPCLFRKLDIQTAIFHTFACSL